MTIKISKKTLISIIVFALVTALVIGMIIFIPKIQKMIEEAKWKKGIYILPTSQYHAFGIDENATMTQLNFVSVRESEETFLNFLKEYHFVLSNDKGEELELVFQESFHFIMQRESVILIEEGEYYQHYAINFRIEFSTRENREFDSISIYKNENEKKRTEIGQLIFNFHDFQTNAAIHLWGDGSGTVQGSSFALHPDYFMINIEDNYTVDSIIVRLIDAVSESGELSSTESISFKVNGACFSRSCSYEFDPFFNTTNDFLIYTLKPLVKYFVDDVEYFDTYFFPLLYYRVLEEGKYLEASQIFTNIL